MKNFKYKEILGAILVVTLFILASYFSKEYNEELTEVISGRGVFAELTYILVVISGFVFAPLNTLFLLPVAVSLWGILKSIALSVVAWTLGSTINYFLSRKFGRPLVLKMVDKEKIEKYSGMIPQKNIFWTLVFFHIVFPGDVLGYVLGLLIKIPYWKYLMAVFIGVIPFAFVLSYAASLSVKFQIGVAVLSLFVILFGFWRVKKKKGK